MKMRDVGVQYSSEDTLCHQQQVDNNSDSDEDITFDKIDIPSRSCSPIKQKFM